MKRKYVLLFNDDPGNRNFTDYYSMMIQVIEAHAAHPGGCTPGHRGHRLWGYGRKGLVHDRVVENVKNDNEY